MSKKPKLFPVVGFDDTRVGFHQDYSIRVNDGSDQIINKIIEAVQRDLFVGFDDASMRDNDQANPNIESIIRLAKNSSFDTLQPNFFVPCDGLYYKGYNPIAKALAYEKLEIVPSHNFLNDCYKILHAALFAHDEIQEWECVEQLGDMMYVELDAMIQQYSITRQEDYLRICDEIVTKIISELRSYMRDNIYVTMKEIDMTDEVQFYESNCSMYIEICARIILKPLLLSEKANRSLLSFQLLCFRLFKYYTFLESSLVRSNIHMPGLYKSEELLGSFLNMSLAIVIAKKMGMK